MSLETTTFEGLTDTDGLIKAVWSNAEVAPGERTLARMRKARIIPYIQCNRLIYYDVAEVKRALAERLTIRSRQAGRRAA